MSNEENTEYHYKVERSDGTVDDYPNTIQFKIYEKTGNLHLQDEDDNKIAAYAGGTRALVDRVVDA